MAALVLNFLCSILPTRRSRTHLCPVHLHSAINPLHSFPGEFDPWRRGSLGGSGDRKTHRPWINFQGQAWLSGHAKLALSGDAALRGNETGIHATLHRRIPSDRCGINHFCMFGVSGLMEPESPPGTSRSYPAEHPGLQLRAVNQHCRNTFTFSKFLKSARAALFYSS